MRTSLLLLLLMAAGIAGATDVPPGTVSGVWSAEGSPYHVLGDITIPSGEGLLVEAGVTVVFEGDYQLTAEGVLTAHGTEADSITFSAATAWAGVRLEHESLASALSFCRITGAETGVKSVASPVSVSHCRLSEHVTAIDVFGVGETDPPTVTIAHSYISDCQNHGIFIVENSNTRICDCEITRCALDGSPRGAIQLSNQSAGGHNDPQLDGNWIHHNVWQGLTAFDITGAGNIRPTVTDNTIEYNYTGVYLLYASGRFDRNQINQNFVEGNPNSGAGVMVYGAAALPTFTRCTFTGNFTGFYVVEGASVNLGDLQNGDPTDDGENHIYGNVDPGNNTWSVYNASAADIKAENNTWDSDDFGEIAETIFDGNDSPASGIVDFDPIRPLAAVDLLGAPGQASISCQPNPFRGHTNILWDSGPGPSGDAIQIFSADGRLIRTLLSESGVTAWDATDESGRALPAGCYWARTAPGRAVHPLRLLR